MTNEKDNMPLVGRRPKYRNHVRWAIYRIHYGLDFLSQSIESIRDDVDKIFICYSLDPWVVKDKVSYLGEEIDMPRNPESVQQYLSTYDVDPKIDIFRAEFNTPLNQFRELYDMAREREGLLPSKVVFMEPDMVYKKGDLSKMFDDLNTLSDETMIPAISTYQIELWKSFKWRVPQRERTGPVIYNIDVTPGFTTHFGPEPGKCGSMVVHSDIKNYNFGFCLNSLTMYYKHLTAINFSKEIGDSIPSQEWYRDKWSNWVPETEDLEIAENYKYLIKRAEPFDMPEEISDQMHGQI